MAKRKLTHVDGKGAARMVDVGEKEPTRRAATVRGEIRFSKEAFGLLRANRLAKGDAIAIARLAGIQAGKRTADWIPLCHTIPLDRLDVAVTLHARRQAAEVVAVASARWVTGVEMEAYVAAAAALLTLYDMTKAVDRGAVIGPVRLEEKSGGRTGRWVRPPRGR